MPSLYLRKAMLCIVLCIAVAAEIAAQATTTITTGPKWKDAMIMTSQLASESYFTTKNFGTYPRMPATAWTHSSKLILYRTLVKWDFSEFDPATQVESAVLYLYSDPANTSGEISNSTLSGANTVHIQRATQNWDETTVSWANGVTSTATGRVVLPASTSATENVTIDVTGLVREMVLNPATNYGIVMSLESEVKHRARNYASTNHPNTSLHPKLVITTTHLIKGAFDRVFGSLNQTEINSGILADYGLDLADHEIYNGTITDENEMNMDKWRALYGSLLSSVINPSSSMIHLKTINQTLSTQWASYDPTDPVIDVPVQLIRYQVLRDDALTNNLISNQNGVLQDVAGRPMSPYLSKYAFAAAPHLGYDDDGRVSFAIRSSLFVNSSDKAVLNFAADFDDGNGYQVLTLNTAKPVVYTSSGIKSLKFRLTCTDGTVYYSHAKFQVEATTSTGMAPMSFTESDSRSFIFPRSKDTNCPESGFPDPESNQPIPYGATVTVHYGGNRTLVPCNNPQFYKPLIVVEGFDVSGYSSFGIKNWGYRQFLTNEANGGLLVNTSSNGTLNNALDVAGYDLIFVDFQYGAADIITNALMVENVIRWVNEHKVVNPQSGVREKNVVWGQSMGGLVARYAVCDLEKRFINGTSQGRQHEVRLLVTSDSPHRGANVPLGFQVLINNLAGQNLTKIGLVSYGITGAIMGSRLDFADVVPQLEHGKELLNAGATRQMLLVQDGQTNTFLDGAYRSMVTPLSGHTPTFTMRALANGSECGLQQDVLAPGGELLYEDASFYASPLLFYTAGTSAGATTTFFGANLQTAGLGVLTTVATRVFVPFMGKKWKSRINIRATPSSGTGVLMSAKFEVQKKILFAIPINLTIHNSSRSSVADAIPWDSHPGGVYDLHSFRAKIPSNPNINAYPILEANLTIRMAQGFNFVPTVSALDIVPPLSNPAATSTYTNGVNTTYQSRFDNFITQDRLPQPNNLPSLNNSPHLWMTMRSADWFFAILQGGNPTLGCAHGCTPAAGSTSIDGPAVVCEQLAQYTLLNMHAGVTNVWSSTNPERFTTSVNPTTGVLTLTAKNPPNLGPATLTATLTKPGCGTYRIVKPINIGPLPWPPMSYENGLPEYFSPGIDQQFRAGEQASFTVGTYPGAVGPYTWTNLSNATVNFSSVQSAQITFGQPGYAYINVRVQGPCGLQSTGNSYRVVGTSLTGIAAGGYSYHPNPVNETLTISRPAVAETTNKDAAVTENRQTTYQVRLVDSTGNEVMSAEGHEAMSLDTRLIPNGLYYMTVITENGSFSESIIVEH